MLRDQLSHFKRFPLISVEGESLRWFCSGLVLGTSTRPQQVEPNNKNKHPGVELVPQCEDLNEEHVELPRHTVRGNLIPHSRLFFSLSLSFPPPFPPYPPFFLPCSPLTLLEVPYVLTFNNVVLLLAPFYFKHI